MSLAAVLAPAAAGRHRSRRAARPPPPTRMRAAAAAAGEPDPAVEDREPADAPGSDEAPPPRERPRIDTVSPRVADAGRGRTMSSAAVIVVGRWR